ncbi:hypothetical protein H5410_036527 [Solanum commersonii]|uniref:Uncharacterized protein n=1 Tax=Solanum commersonii TaxID=4109 RepID=A0A9J5Y5W4_SOLCO|nr:hypothetical protein H5410_036527 [Solanum commersonii]
MRGPSNLLATTPVTSLSIIAPSTFMLFPYCHRIVAYIPLTMICPSFECAKKMIEDDERERFTISSFECTKKKNDDNERKRSTI